MCGRRREKRRRAVRNTDNQFPELALADIEDEQLSLRHVVEGGSMGGHLYLYPGRDMEEFVRSVKPF